MSGYHNSPSWNIQNPEKLRDTLKTKKTKNNAQTRCRIFGFIRSHFAGWPNNLCCYMATADGSGPWPSSMACGRGPRLQRATQRAKQSLPYIYQGL